jgi:hypothetical protein
MMTLSKIKLVVTVSLVGILSSWLIGSAQGAQLRYIRIGEHEAFTRVVFEFRGPAVFEKPQVRGKGKLSVVFLDTTTALPRHILSETTKRVDTIEFVQQDTHLAAQITLSFPYFRLKSFSLSNPERVVLDIYRMETPPENVIFGGSIQEGSERAVAEADKPLEQPRSFKNKPTIQEAQGHSQRPPQDPAKRSAATLPREPATAVGEIAKPEPDRQGPSVDHSAQHSPWQTYPLAILMVLSIVLVALLSFIVFQKRRGPGSRQGVWTLDPTLEAKESMAAIDKRIKDEFNKFDQL